MPVRQSSHLRAPLLVAFVALLSVTACAGAPGSTPALRPGPPAVWPVSPEPLPSATSVLSAEFGPATWALDPAFPAPGPASTELDVLVWEQQCSSGSPTTGRMSAPVIAYGATTVTITIGVRPFEGAQACPGPPGTPALVRLSEPLGTRSLLDGGRVPPAPPTPGF
jgi:hypothetical protein